MPFLIYVYIAIQLLVVTYYDIRTRTISNMWSILNIILFLVLIFLFPQNYTISFETFVWPVGFFVAGFILFTLRVMGGGDAKYLATFFLVVPQKFHELTFEALAVATILVGTSVFLKNVFSKMDSITQAWTDKNPLLLKNILGEKFAYAPVIFVSWIWFGWQIQKEMF